MDETNKSVAQSQPLRDSTKQFFDNPLRREFLNLEEVADFFQVSERWILTQVIRGHLPCHQVGRSTKLFYLPEIREAILADVLTQSKGKNHDRSKSQKQKWQRKLPSQYQSPRTPSLQTLRQQRTGATLE